MICEYRESDKGSFNRGKGSTITRAMRHAGGEYTLLAEADRASIFNDLRKVLVTCQNLETEIKEKKKGWRW
jgi:hypothetical protein